MSTITISKIEYKQLKKESQAYRKILNLVEPEIFSSPPIKSAKVILKSFKGTGKYSAAFLTDLGKGLKRSSYFTK